MVKLGTPRSASEVTGSRFMLRGAGDLGANGLAGHPEAYGWCSVAQRQAGEVLEGGCGHRFTGGGLGHDLLGPAWAPHGHAAVHAHGPVGPDRSKFESLQK